MLDHDKLAYEAPDFSEGAASPVHYDGRYCGLVIRERSNTGFGWVFTAAGPCGNFSSEGHRSLRDAAALLAAHDDNGNPIN